jgi:hypothetical protein
MSYPTMQKLAPGRYESAEQRDGVPDYVLERVEGGWSLKSRTSGRPSGFRTSREALETLRETYGDV